MGKGPGPSPRRCACSDCACCDEEDKEERETAALHILEVPRLDAPDITPICHGTPNAGAGGHKMLMGDDREATAGLGLGDQDRGWSAAARQATEKESFTAEERGDYHQDAHMNDRSHVSGTPLFGGG